MTVGARDARLCLATSYDPGFVDIGSYCAVGLHLYAARWNFAVHVQTHISIDRPPAWDRVRLLLSLFDAGHEFVMWTDADSIFTRFDANILDEVREGKDLYMVEHDHPSFLGSRVPNTGVMLVRNCAWSRALFERLWTMREYDHHNWWENAAMIDLLGYHNLLGDRPFAPNQEMLARVRFLDPAWNHIPSICDGGNPIIRHFAGMPGAVRRGEMPRYAAQACVNRLADMIMPPAAPAPAAPNPRLADIEQMHAAMLASTSWRITAPLRALSRLLRG